ncbi:MAG: hypothetical protein CVU44_21080 [Chloroflexi bacterium HGW-Chloroflexi-6]|nr:MAG: hypothetical protein CVU44_21080 [Chloroflexi bacterium HGW-Chloroflexi-6]
MQVVISKRDFSGPLATPFEWTAESFDWSIYGGPTIASLSAPDNVYRWDAAKLLRCPVEILDDKGTPVWWGFVQAATIPQGTLGVGISLDGMYNAVAVTYANMPAGATTPSGQNTTAWALANESISEYGQRELLENMSDGTAAAAEARRDRILSEYRYPNAVVAAFGGDRIKLELRGWWDVLSWRYYANGGTAAAATLDQAAAMVATFTPLLTGAHLAAVSGLSTNQFRDGQTNAKSQIEELLKLGTSSGGRLAAIVNRSRVLRIDALPSASTPDLRLREDGKLENIADLVLDAARLDQAVGRWATLKSAPTVVGNYSTIHPFLIESATWRTGTASYKPVGQRDVFSIGKDGGY